MARVVDSWFKSFDEKEAIRLANDFRIVLAFAKSHERLHRILETYLKEGILPSAARKSFYESSQKLTEASQKLT